VLSAAERATLEPRLVAGSAPTRKLTHARILLKADQGPGGPGWVDQAIAEAVEVSQPSLARVRRQCVAQGLEAALKRRAPRRADRRKLDGEQAAPGVALACSSPPTGRDRWSLRRLADRLVALEVVDRSSYQTIRRRLKETH
jgi:hypothetical protein